MVRQMAYTLIDSFCGAGGLSLGLKKAGFANLLSFDNDPRCIETLLLNPEYFVHRFKLASIDDMLKGAIYEYVKEGDDEIFLLAGGPPCQGFSVQRIGKDEDVRNNLVIKFFELAEKIKPVYILMENVPGLTGIRGKQILDEALKFADSIGYWMHKKKLDAQFYGVPQRRTRVFLVGERKDTGFPTFQFPLPSLNVEDRKTVKQTIGHLPSPPSDGSDHPDYPHHRRDRLSRLNLQRLAALGQGEGRKDLPKHLLAACHKNDADKIGHRYVYGRMAWNEVAPTITARFDSFTRGKFGHPEELRSISLLEGALLQTFPIDYLFSGNKVDIARQIGNAVPPKLAYALGKQIINCYKLKELTKKSELKN